MRTWLITKAWTLLTVLRGSSAWGPHWASGKGSPVSALSIVWLCPHCRRNPRARALPPEARSCGGHSPRAPAPTFLRGGCSKQGPGEQPRPEGLHSGRDPELTEAERPSQPAQGEDVAPRCGEPRGRLRGSQNPAICLRTPRSGPEQALSVATRRY